MTAALGGVTGCRVAGSILTGLSCTRFSAGACLGTAGKSMYLQGGNQKQTSLAKCCAVFEHPCSRKSCTIDAAVPVFWSIAKAVLGCHSRESGINAHALTVYMFLEHRR